MTYLVSDLLTDRAFVEVHGLCAARVFLKIEALNPAGSIKIKAARGMISALVQAGRIGSDTRLIESSSGNLGVALAMICAEKSIPFTCVIDPNTAESNRKTIEALGAEVVVVCNKDENGGYLGSRISYIKERVSREPNTIWLNQYANPANPGEHVRTTARAISEGFAQIDYLFVGAGTTGTLMGCRDFFIDHRPDTKIVAVDSVGSVTFGFPAGKRHIPGLGTSRRPEVFGPHGLHAVEMIEEQKAVRMCRWLARTHGLLAGGSTGTVLAGIYEWQDRLTPDDVIVSISPDLGDRYLDTIYNDAWVTQRFGADALSSDLTSNTFKNSEAA
ncbi:2,3-diaminopropionate biosynthesis protein SbnA [Epibacterium ulvae]|uniref:2,3-diaminopropionate biosynthesis protein SbnA n=1 Tax=Epibacterium ulvae TaxID=1156985 RepID=UPI0024905130|nr:2,3-diaminopropionate biosynthesis protein SbnA [Epibacterium ulvae]